MRTADFAARAIRPTRPYRFLATVSASSQPTGETFPLFVSDPQPNITYRIHTGRSRDRARITMAMTTFGTDHTPRSNRRTLALLREYRLRFVTGINALCNGCSRRADQHGTPSSGRCGDFIPNQECITSRGLGFVRDPHYASSRQYGCGKRTRQHRRSSPDHKGRLTPTEQPNNLDIECHFNGRWCGEWVKCDRYSGRGNAAQPKRFWRNLRRVDNLRMEQTQLDVQGALGPAFAFWGKTTFKGAGDPDGSSG